MERYPQCVSIPYEREGIFRHTASIYWTVSEVIGFNSLRTGRYLQTGHRSHSWINTESGFNSLRTGRYLQTLSIHKNLSRYTYDSVSIPYEREGIFRQDIGCRFGDIRNKFQFPTNGKVSSDSHKETYTMRTFSFNSLRTGRYLQTKEGMTPYRGGLRFNSLRTGRYLQTKSSSNRFTFDNLRFNSLRTGRYLQTRPIFDPDGPWLQTPQNQTRTARGFFLLKIYPENPTNPYGH